MDAFIIPAKMVDRLRNRFSDYETIEPVLIQSGPYEGSYMLDVDILNREPRLEALLGRDVTKGKLKAAGVIRAEIELESPSREVL